MPSEEASGDPAPIQVTYELNCWANGDPEALNRAFPEIYNELRRLAESRLRGRDRGRTLTASDLLHEAYLKLVKTGAKPFTDRGAFFCFAATIMRHILVDRARKASAVKRQKPHEDNSAAVGKPAFSSQLLAVDDGIAALSRIDPQLAEVAKLKYFGGLKIAEIAESLKMSEATVKRRWTTARTWLEDHMHNNARKGHGAGRTLLEQPSS